MGKAKEATKGPDAHVGTLGLQGPLPLFLMVIAANTFSTQGALLSILHVLACFLPIGALSGSFYDYLHFRGENTSAF